MIETIGSIGAGFFLFFFPLFRATRFDVPLHGVLYEPSWQILIKGGARVYTQGRLKNPGRFERFDWTCADLPCTAPANRCSKFGSTSTRVFERRSRVRKDIVTSSSRWLIVEIAKSSLYETCQALFFNKIDKGTESGKETHTYGCIHGEKNFIANIWEILYLRNY